MSTATAAFDEIDFSGEYRCGLDLQHQPVVSHQTLIQKNA